MCGIDGKLYFDPARLVERDVLERRGHGFRSRCDTDVILHPYEEHGTDCLRFLRGMFAFGIWDGPRRQLFLARDRLGKKPLCYQQGAEAFRFASEVKAVLQDPAVEVRPDPAGIAEYLTCGYGRATGPASAPGKGSGGRWSGSRSTSADGHDADGVD